MLNGRSKNQKEGKLIFAVSYLPFSCERISPSFPKPFLPLAGCPSIWQLPEIVPSFQRSLILYSNQNFSVYPSLFLCLSYRLLLALFMAEKHSTLTVISLFMLKYYPPRLVLHGNAMTLNRAYFQFF